MGMVTRGHGAETRTRGPERDRAKVQTGAELLCKSGRDGARGGKLACGHGDTGGNEDTRAGESWHPASGG